MTPRDHTIKRLISDFGPLTIDHLISLAAKENLGSPDTIWRRLRQTKPLLNDGVYINKRSRSEKYVYAAYNIRRRKDFDHDLMITDILVALHLHFDLRYWRRPKQKFHARLNEDLYAVLGLPTGQLHYFIEADTGSEGYKQIGEKMTRYLRQYEAKGQPFIVLFITQDEGWLSKLLDRLEDTIPRGKRRMFLFTTLDQFISTPDQAICRLPHDPAAYTILPKLAQ